MCLTFLNYTFPIKETLSLNYTIPIKGTHFAGTADSAMYTQFLSPS